jgi:hypothetical protein
MDKRLIPQICRLVAGFAIVFSAPRGVAQQDFAQSVAPVFRQIVPPNTRCYFGQMNGNAICEYTITNGNNYDSLRLEAGQFDMPLRVRSIELTQTTTDRNSAAGAQQVQIIKDFIGRYGFTYEQLVSCMRSGVQGFWEGIGPQGFGAGKGAVTAGAMTMNCKVNTHAPTERGGTITIDLRPSKAPNEF